MQKQAWVFPTTQNTSPWQCRLANESTSTALAAITSTGDQLSEWSTWLHTEFHEDLVQQVKRKNKIRGTAALDHNLIQRLPAFVSGTSDLLV
jgi:hypothetical protein